MKSRFYIFLCVILFPLFLVAQEELDQRYLFDKFEKGRVVYKKGGVSGALFNYNILTGKLVFLGDDATIMELANPSLISTVDIGGRIFEQVKGSDFYEKIKLSSEDLPLYIKWHSSLVTKGKTGAYGIKSVNTSSVEKASLNQDNDSRIFELKVDKDIVMNPKNTFFLKIDNKFKKFSSVDSLAKLFKNENEIKEYLKSQKLDFKNIDDVKKAVEFCSQFMK